MNSIRPWRVSSRLWLVLCPSSVASLSVVTHCSAHVKRIISTSFKGLEHLRAFHAVKHFPAEGKKWKKSKEQFVCSSNCPPLHYGLAVNKGCLFSKPGNFPLLLLSKHSYSVVMFRTLLYVLQRHVTHALLSPTKPLQNQPMPAISWPICSVAWITK